MKKGLLEEYRRFLNHLELAYRELEAGMTPAEPVPAGPNEFIMRLPVNDARHAILLKLAAMIHFLNGALTLCEAGILLGQGALQRMAEEAGEDAAFLTLGVLNGMEKRHEDFLDYFWREDFSDFNKVPDSFQSRPQVPRDKVVAAIHAINPDPSTGQSAAKVLSKSYSGFVHAAAPHVMEIYDSDSRKLGVSAAPHDRQHGYEIDLWNYMYRSGTYLMIASKALGAESQFDLIGQYLEEFQDRTGRDGGYRRKPSTKPAPENS